MAANMQKPQEANGDWKNKLKLPPKVSLNTTHQTFF